MPVLEGLQSTAAGSLGFCASGTGDSFKELATPPSLAAGVRHTGWGAGECDSSAGQTWDQGSGVPRSTHAAESFAPPGGGGGGQVDLTPHQSPPYVHLPGDHALVPGRTKWESQTHRLRGLLPCAPPLHPPALQQRTWSHLGHLGGALLDLKVGCMVAVHGRLHLLHEHRRSNLLRYGRGRGVTWVTSGVPFLT